MDQKEFTFKGSVQNGFLMLFANIAITVLSIIGIVRGIILLDSTSGATHFIDRFNE